MDIIDIYRLLHLTVAEYTFFSNSHRTFPTIDHIMGHKICFNEIKKTRNHTMSLLDHNKIKLEINMVKITEKY